MCAIGGDVGISPGDGPAIIYTGTACACCSRLEEDEEEGTLATEADEEELDDPLDDDDDLSTDDEFDLAIPTRTGELSPKSAGWHFD